MSRSNSSGVAVPAAFLLAVLLTGCGQQAAPPASGTASGPAASGTTTAPPGQGPSPGGTASQEPSSGGTPSTAGAPTASAAWTKYTTADGQLTFDVPAAWTVTDPAGELAEGGGAFAEVRNQAGKPLATLRTNMATGSTCTERYPYAILDSQEMPALTRNGMTPRYVFETRGNAENPGPADTPEAAYGIVTGPVPTGDSACYMFHFFFWPPNSAMFGAFYNPANNETPGDATLPYLEQAKRYADTSEYRDIRRMITSLRPTS